MRLGVLLLLLACAFAYAALDWGGPGLILLWPVLSLVVLTAGYFGLGPAILGKRPSGALSWYSYLVHGPYLLYSSVIWHALRLVRRERSMHRVSEGLYVGRRPLAGELPDDVAVVVDLTAEFREPRGVRAGRRYISYPVLDGGTPHDLDAFAKLATKLAACREVIYIHCAEGHGRSGTLAAAVMLARGLAGDADAAIAELRAIREGMRLHRTQRESLMAVAALLGRS